LLRCQTAKKEEGVQAKAAWVIAVLLVSTSCSGPNDTGANLPVQPSPLTNLAAPGGPGVYAVQGSAYDSVGRPLRGVVVSVQTGPQAGMSTTTDETGTFTLAGVTGLATIRAQKDGYKEQAKTSYVWSGLPPETATVWFKLESALRPIINLAGTYAVTFSADHACPALPEIVRDRTYVATLGTTGWWQLITLAGASFEKSQGYPSYPGHYDWNVISLSLFEDFGSLYFEDPPIHEIVDSGETLEISGHADGPVTASSTQLQVVGTFRFAGQECHSANHRLVIERIAS